MVQHGDEHGRHAGHHGRLRLVDQLHGVVEHEARHDHDLGAIGDGEVHHRGHGEDVEEGQRCQHALVAGHQMRRPGRALPAVGGDVGVGEHGALGGAGGAAGILQHRDVGQGIDGRLLVLAVVLAHIGVGDDVGCHRRLRRVGQVLALEELEEHRLGARQQGREGGDDRPLQRAGLHQAFHLVEQQLEIERDHQLGLAVLDLEGQLLERVEGVVVDDRAAGLQRGEVVNDEGRAVRHQEPHLGALLDAELLQPGGRPIDHAADLSVAQDLAQEVGAGTRGVLGDRVVEQLVEGGRGELLVPVDALGVAIEPLIRAGLAGVCGSGLGRHR